MKRAFKLAAIAAMVTLLAATSAFADWRHPRETDRRHDRDDRDRFITVEGRVRDIDRERNGFVIRLDRGGYVLFARANTDVRGDSNRRNTRVRDLRPGDWIRATGTTESSRLLEVNEIRFLRGDRGPYDRGDRVERTLTGVVTSVDRSRGLLELREERSGRTIIVVARHAEWDDFDEVRRGNRIVVSGQFHRNGRFEAERIDIDHGRW